VDLNATSITNAAKIRYCGTIYVDGKYLCYRKDGELIGQTIEHPHNSARFLVVSAEDQVPPMLNNGYNGAVLEGSYKMIMGLWKDGKWFSRYTGPYCSFCFTTMGNFSECPECYYFPPNYCSEKCRESHLHQHLGRVIIDSFCVSKMGPQRSEK
jgi:hypothetical protein